MEKLIFKFKAKGSDLIMGKAFLIEDVGESTAQNQLPYRIEYVSFTDLGAASILEVTEAQIRAYVVAQNFANPQNLRVRVVEPIFDIDYDIDFDANGLAAVGITDQASFENHIGWTVSDFSIVGNNLKCNVVYGSEELDLKNLGIVNVRKISYIDCEILDLSYNQLTSIDNATFPSNLQQLNLSQNQILSIYNATFPVNLYRLYFEYNQLTSIDNTTFPVNLEVLSLVGNQLTSIDNTTFPVNLQILGLFSNQLTSIDTATFPVNLEELLLSDNKLVELSVNNILVWTDASTNISSLSLQAGTNAAPTGAGITAYNSLISKGVTVTTN